MKSRKLHEAAGHDDEPALFARPLFGADPRGEVPGNPAPCEISRRRNRLRTRDCCRGDNSMKSFRAFSARARARALGYD